MYRMTPIRLRISPACDVVRLGAEKKPDERRDQMSNQWLRINIILY
jgi:hypothetical protein